jgi:hypothetical protein
VRQRLHELSANFDPRDTLEHRTEEALAILSNTAILGKIIPAIDTLGASLSLLVLCQDLHPIMLHTARFPVYLDLLCTLSFTFRYGHTFVSTMLQECGR